MDPPKTYTHILVGLDDLSIDIHLHPCDGSLETALMWRTKSINITKTSEYDQERPLTDHRTNHVPSRK